MSASGLDQLGLGDHAEVAEEPLLYHLHLDGLDNFADLVEAADDAREAVVVLHGGDGVPDLLPSVLPAVFMPSMMIMKAS
jgi:hypothetical protein